MNPIGKESQNQKTSISNMNDSAQQEMNIIILNDDQQLFLKNNFDKLIEKKQLCQKAENYLFSECKTFSYTFTQENQMILKININQINTKEIKDFSLLENFFESLANSENIILIKINFTFDEVTLNNDIFHFLYHLNSHKVKLAEIKLFFDFPHGLRKTIEMQLADKKQQINFFQKHLDSKYFSKYLIFNFFYFFFNF